MFDFIEDSLEWSSPVVFELYFEGVRELLLFVLKDNIKEVDKPWTTVAFYESLYDGIWLDIFNWNFKCVPLGIFDFSNICLSDNKMPGVSKNSKLVEGLDCKDGA